MLRVAIFLAIFILSCKSGENLNEQDSIAVQQPSLKKLVRGKELSGASEVVFYYDSLRNSLLRVGDAFSLPEIIFVPGWGEYICNEEYRKHTAVVTDTVPGDESGRNQEYELYAEQSAYSVKVGEGYFNVETTNSPARKYLFVLDAKIFRNADHEIVLGLQQSESSENNSSHQSDFYVLRKGAWIKVNLSIQDSDRPSVFFSGEVDEAFIIQTRFMELEFDFEYAGDTVYVKPYSVYELDCSTPASENPIFSDAEKSKVCGYLEQMKTEGLPYIFDKSLMSFRRIVPVTKIKTN